LHPKKRLRPFAAGDLQASAGLGIALLLLAAAFTGAHFLPAAFLRWLLVYTGATLAYSLYLKKKVLVDVIVLSGLYTLRLLAGGAAAHVKISPWLAGFSVFLFLSLAMLKRFSELQNNRAQGLAPTGSRGYLLVDIEQLRSFGTASGYAAVVVFSLYISSHDIIALFSCRADVVDRAPFDPMDKQGLAACRAWSRKEILNRPGCSPCDQPPIDATYFQTFEMYETRKKAIPDPTTLILVDEADRLQMTSLEQMRSIFDEGTAGMVLSPSPGSKSESAKVRTMLGRIALVPIATG
jgi:hypothetical protein